MNILTDTHNVLLHRRELTCNFRHEGNPGYALVKKKLSEHLGASEDLIVIKRLTNAYGAAEFQISALLYDSSAALTACEPAPKVQKAGGSS